MINVQKAWRQFYSRFCENVFTQGELIQDIFPRIVFTYSSCEFGTRNIETFQIYSNSTNEMECLSIARQIEKAIPVGAGHLLKVATGITYEYYDYFTGTWKEFKLEDFAIIAQEHYNNYPDEEFKWRENTGGIKGSLELFRGTPFIQPRPFTEVGVIAFYGNIEVLSNLI